MDTKAQIVPEQPPLDLIWGAANVGKVIGKSPRQTFFLLEARQLPAQKVGGRWVSSRAGLEARFTAG